MVQKLAGGVSIETDQDEEDILREIEAIVVAYIQFVQAIEQPKTFAWTEQGREHLQWNEAGLTVNT